MSNNTRKLIDTLRAGLDDRFSNIHVVNRDPETGEKGPAHQGALSVVFRARDEESGQHVALKFFDPDFQGRAVPYRMQLFEREAEILQGLRGKRGLLQLVHPITEMQIVAAEGSQSVTLTETDLDRILRMLDSAARHLNLSLVERHKRRVRRDQRGRRLRNLRNKQDGLSSNCANTEGKCCASGRCRHQDRDHLGGARRECRGRGWRRWKTQQPACIPAHTTSA